MPYDALSDLPDNVKSLPKHAQEIYLSAFNSAFKQYDNEAKAHGTAWAAVKVKYHKNQQGNWVAKEAIHPHGDHICICSKCKHEQTVKEDVKCNTQQCAECGEAMVAKQAGEKRTEANMTNVVKEAELSDENKRQMLQAGLTTEYKLDVDNTIPRGVWVEDVFENYVIYRVNDQAYKASYKMGEDGVVTFGEPQKVVSQRVYKPMESLQTRYSEIIQEAGKRNAILDSGRIKKIVQLCQELLSSDEPDEKAASEALKEADKTLVWLKEQAVMATEDGEKYPASAFAYVPDAEKASTWKLRLWEDPTKKITRAQLGRAAAALSPGGFRGQKAQIPSTDLAAVKRKIRAEYRKLDVEEDKIPKWVKETETRELLQNFVPLTEAKFDKGRATVIIIKPGFNTDESRYYPAEMLKRDYHIFEGQKMYADHPTEEEDEARPERSIKDWVATLTEVTCDESGVVSGIAEIVEPWLMQKLASLRDKDMLSEMGISINSIGSATKGTIDGKETLIIEKLVASRSVDFVTEPGAGGIVTMYESDRGHDIDLVELATLKERRPDLVKAVEADIRAVITKEVKKAMENEDKIKDLEGQIETLTTERDALKEAAEKAEKDKAKAEAQATIKEAVDKAELPDASKKRLLERFKDAESAEGIEEAIEDKKAEIAELSEAGHVKGMGGSKPDSQADHEALKESWKKLHPEWGDEQIETAIRGR